MKTILALFVFILSATTANAKAEYHLVSWCSIYSMAGVLVKSFPGENCLFLDDGSFISASLNGIRRIDHKNNILWELKGMFHHQMNISVDKKKILSIGTTVTKETGFTLYDDELLVISLEGKVLHRKNSSFLLNHAKIPGLFWKRDIHVMKEHEPVKEFAHINSFYEFAPVSGKKTPSYLKDGGYIVNGLDSGMFILNSDLSMVLHHRKFPQSEGHWVHDVQVTDDGQFLYFNNKVSDSKALSHYSAVEIMDPVTGKVIWNYSSSSPELFYSHWCGSVQEMDKDLFLFADHLNGTYLYSRKQKKLVNVLRSTHLKEGVPLPVLQVKAYQLDKFFISYGK